MSRDLYEILGIDETADAEEIRRAFRGLAKEHHPDRAGDSSSERFREIRDAYDVLSDPPARDAYDDRKRAVVVSVIQVERPSDWGEPVHIGRSAPKESEIRNTRRRGSSRAGFELETQDAVVEILRLLLRF